MSQELCIPKPMAWSSTSTISSVQTPAAAPLEPRDAYTGLNFLLVCIGLSVLILAIAHIARVGKARRR